MLNFVNRKRINPKDLTYTGKKYLDKVDIQLFEYNSESCIEKKELALDKFTGFSENQKLFWLNTHGIHDQEIINLICSKTGIHDLVIQDILDVNLSPKIQEYENFWFFCLKSISINTDMNLEVEQISFILGNNYIITFQEKKSDYFEHIRERLRKYIGKVRERSIDYLFYLLVESVIDNYNKSIFLLEDKSQKTNLLNFDADPDPLILASLEKLRKIVYQISQFLSPIKDLVSLMERGNIKVIQKKHFKYYYNLRALTKAILDICDKIDRDIDSKINLFFSLQGHKMNQIMKTLTIIATIFIPLTFLVGIYGMNFTNMPELNWKYGYFTVWGIMILITLAMIYYFKKKKWL